VLSYWLQLHTHLLYLSELRNLSWEISFIKLWHYAMCSKPSCLEKNPLVQKFLNFNGLSKLVHYSDISAKLCSVSTSI